MRGTVSKRRLLCGQVVALRPTLSAAAKAKGEILCLEAQIAAARRAGDAVKTDQLEREHAQLVVNSLR